MARFTARIQAEIPALRRYALVLVHDPDRADDLVQDCLERALRRHRLWRRPGNLRAWLFTILRHIHANQLRALRRQPEALSVKEHTAPVASGQFDQVQLEQTLEALWRLSADQREVLLLVAVEGLTYREVSAVLDIPTGTVMSRLSRARERLRVLIEGAPSNSLRRVK